MNKIVKELMGTGLDKEQSEAVLEDMIGDLDFGVSPEDLLEDHGLELDLVYDLLAASATEVLL